MINNKKIFLIYIFCFFLFITLITFPNYSNKIRLISFFIKEKLENPFIFVSNRSLNFFYSFRTNQELINSINDLKKQNDYLKNINNYYKLLTSKFNEQNKIFHENSLIIPQSIGVSITGDRDLFYNKNFIINKGSSSGIEISDYVIDGLEIVGRIKSVDINTSEVVTVKSIHYGDEVLVNGRSFIVSGTNNNYLSFLRQRDSLEDFNFSFGQVAKVELNLVNLKLGIIDFFENQPIIITKKKFNLDNLRVVTDD